MILVLPTPHLFQTIIEETNFNILYHWITLLPCFLSNLCLTPTPRRTCPLPHHYFSPYPSGSKQPHNLSPFLDNLRSENPPYTSSPHLISIQQITRLHIPSGSYYSHFCSSISFSLHIPSNSTSKTPLPLSTTYTKPSIPSPHPPNPTMTHS